MQNFFSELQRRKVLRVGSAYIVAGWALVQGASTLETVLNLPGWFDTLIFAIVGVMFPVALALAWFYEFTDQGVRRTLVSGDGKMHAPQLIDWALLGLVIALGLFIAVEATVPSAQSIKTATAPKPASESLFAPTLGDKSIAVLPFANLSPDKANDYFADGLTEELLNIIAKMGGLKVTSRTSSFAFKGKATALPDIAKMLGVRHVLEGSIRRDGDDVRVTAQLIDVLTDTHLWSETYDRKIEKIFAIQDEIARAIAEKLNIEVTLAAASDAPTKNVEAYRAYLEARSLFRQREKQDLARALDLLKTATDVEDGDPKFAEAHALTAAIHYVQAVSFPMFETEAPLAREAATKAHELKPTLALPHAIQGGLDMAAYKWMSGVENLKKAVELDPSDTTARLWLGTALLELGRLDAGANTLHEASRLDPLYEIVQAWVARAEYARGARTEAIRRAEDLARKDAPLAHFAEFMLARDAYDRGEIAEAERHYRRSEDTDVPKDLIEAIAKALRSPAAIPDAVKAVKAVALKDETIQPAGYYALLKDDDTLIEWLNERFDKPDQGSTLLLFFSELWPERHKSLQNNPRFQDVLRKRGLIDYWKATTWPDRCKSDGADGMVCE